MKSKSIVLACLSLSSFSCITSFAAIKHLPSSLLYSIPLSKDTGSAGKDHLIEGNTRLNEISIHAVRHFRKSFASITNDKWYKINNGYMVTFIHDSIRNQGYYDTRGVFLGITRTCGEELLPAHIRERIERLYGDYHIDVVSEISKDEELFYIIKVKNSHFIKTLQVNNGKIEVIEEVENSGA